MEEKLYLAFVNPIGKNAHDMYEYEFFFTETPDIVWGEDWNEQCPSACGSLLPAGETYSKIMRLTSIIPFTCAQENSCFSLQDSVDNILALAFENISEYTEYPEPFRLVFHFGEEFESVEDKLAQRHQFFKKDDKDDIKTENAPEE